ncbi:MAG: redox-regulated ATPase YchF [Desulfurococcales archaeon]|nr:redox-regulated ATPase YchF [Desulfurococcales archaeon]
MPDIGLVGKTNVGKSTFFAAATLLPAEISNRPFTTIDPNIGVTHVRTKCVHVELGLPKCDPKNSLCIEGNRFIPVRLVDVAGLVPGAHEGRGLGNKFLDDIRKSDVIILVVDASGSTDPEGSPTRPGMFDPVEEVETILNEIDLWMFTKIKRDWDKFSRTLDSGGITDKYAFIAQRLSGFNIRKEHVVNTFKRLGRTTDKLTTWSDDDLLTFIRTLREVSKPIVIAANKVDKPYGEDGYKRLKESFSQYPVVPTIAIAELALRTAAKRGLIKYIPGDQDFEIIGNPDTKQAEALRKIRDLLKAWNGTGVQQAINTAIFDSLKMIVVYPVEDHNKFTDSKGNILPDAYLVPEGTTAKELAFMIHTDIGKGFLYAINAKTKQRIGENHVLKNGDVIKIVSAK